MVETSPDFPGPTAGLGLSLRIVDCLDSPRPIQSTPGGGEAGTDVLSQAACVWGLLVFIPTSYNTRLYDQCFRGNGSGTLSPLLLSVEVGLPGLWGSVGLPKGHPHGLGGGISGAE